MSDKFYWGAKLNGNKEEKHFLKVFYDKVKKRVKKQINREDDNNV